MPTRRTLLQAGLLGTTGLAALLNRVRAEERNRAATADAVLFLNLGGGPSHLDTLDVKPDGPADTRGEFAVIDTKLPGLAVCEHLPRFAAIADQVALLRGISHTTGDHLQGQQYIASGNRPTPALSYPSYGSVVGRELETPADLPPYVAVPNTEWNAGYMGDAYGPFKTNAVPEPGRPFSVRGITLGEGVTIEKATRRENLLADLDGALADARRADPLLEALDTFGDRAHGMITSERTRAAFAVDREPESIRQLFAADELGQSLLLATRLIESGVRFVTVTNQGWDTHLDNFKGHARLIPPFDAGYTATLEALRQKGLLDRTLVVAMGEFGRTPKINPNVGRDHHPRANWCLFAGGGTKPQLLGATDAGGTGPADGTELKPDDLGATLLHALGIDPETEYQTRTGRPVTLIPKGRVLHELFA
jgi:uncharacterized protein (DUF1501 family)